MEERPLFKGRISFLKEGYPAPHDSMDDPGDRTLSEISQSLKDKHCVIPLT